MTRRLVFGAVLVGASSDGWRRVYLEDDRGGRRCIGFVRQAEGRWFAKLADRRPVEGMFRTRRDAAAAIVAAAIVVAVGAEAGQ